MDGSGGSCRVTFVPPLPAWRLQQGTVGLPLAKRHAGDPGLGASTVGVASAQPPQFLPGAAVADAFVHGPGEELDSLQDLWSKIDHFAEGIANGSHSGEQARFCIQSSKDP